MTNDPSPDIQSTNQPFNQSTTPTHPIAYVFILLFLGLMAVLLYRWLTYTPELANERLGLVFISAPDALADERRLDGALATGARWDRWPLYWHWVDEGGYVGPHTGGHHNYDGLVQQEIERGITPLVILMGTPANEATQEAIDPAEPAPNLPLPDAPPEISRAILPPRSLAEPIFSDGTDQPGPGKTINPANRWAHFVQQTVNRYKPGGELARQRGWRGQTGVRHWEIWNEPDFDLFWRGSVQEYARLLQVGYLTIKQSDPDAIVLLGGIAFYEKRDWFNQLLAQVGNPPPFDVVSIHHYWSVVNGEKRLLETRQLLDAYDLPPLPIWITESGLSVWDDYPATAHNLAPDTPWRGTTAEQAAYVLQNSALAFYHGVERYYHFMLHDDCGDGPSTAFGLRQNFEQSVCNPATGATRPAYAAFQLVAEQFRDLTPLWRESANGIEQVAFYRSTDQSRLLLVWNSQPVTATIGLTATGQSATLHWIDTSPNAEPDQRRQSQRRGPANGRYYLTLPPATNRNAIDPNDPTIHIGGPPLLLVERDTQPPADTILPLPSESPATFVVQWQGQDRGSGVSRYDLWVGVDDGPLAPWLTRTRATQAEFSGEVGHRYRFAVRARDHAGNQSPAPTDAQAETSVVTSPTVTGVVLGPDRTLVEGAVVILTGEAFSRRITTRSDGTWPPVPLLPGSYTAQVQVDELGVWPAPQRFTVETGDTPLDDTTEVSLLLTLPPAQNAIANGDFEGSAVWRSWQWAGRVDRYFQAFDGEFAVRLGHSQGEDAFCDNSVGQQWSVSQVASVPDVVAPMLSFVRQLQSPQPRADTARFEVRLLDEAGQSNILATEQRASDWTLETLDLSPWRGQAVTAQFRVVRCTDEPFTALLDRVSMGK